mgnify:FL=1
MSFKCPFCGSTERMVERVGNDGRPLVEISSQQFGEYEKVYDFCCLPQKKNAEYIEKNYGPDDRPDIDDVGKL